MHFKAPPSQQLNMLSGFIIIALSCFALTTSAQTETTAQSGEARVGDMAPWFGGWTLENRPINRDILISEANGQSTILLFFATWCEPCERSLQLVKHELHRLTSAGVRPVLISSGQGAEDITNWLGQRNLDRFPVITDQYGSISTAFGISNLPGNTSNNTNSSLPLAVLIGPNGRVLDIFVSEGPDFVDRIIASTITNRADEAFENLDTHINDR
jgi:peroxiredoxin